MDGEAEPPHPQQFQRVQLARPASWRSLGDQTPAKATLHRHGAGWDFWKGRNTSAGRTEAGQMGLAGPASGRVMRHVIMFRQLHC